MLFDFSERYSLENSLLDILNENSEEELLNNSFFRSRNSEEELLNNSFFRSRNSEEELLNNSFFRSRTSEEDSLEKTLLNILDIEDEDEVDENRFILERMLGQGTFGEVYLAFDTLRGERVALKLYNSDGFKDYDQEKVAYDILSATPNCDPYIVCMYDSGKFNNRYFISQELMTGDVVEFTGNGQGKNIKYKITNPISLLFIFLQMAEGMRHIHESGMAHLDIKPQNILYKTVLLPELYKDFFNNPVNIRDSVCFKFGDPGFACTTADQILFEHEISSRDDVINFSSCGFGKYYRKSGEVPSLGELDLCSPRGTFLFMAPEFYRAYINRNMTEEEKYVGIRFYQANDIWSLGLTFRTIIKGWSSIEGFNTVSNQKEIPKIELNFTNTTLNHRMKYLLNNMMLVYDFQSRDSAANIVSYIIEMINDYYEPLSPPSSFSNLNPIKIKEVMEIFPESPSRTRKRSTSNQQDISSLERSHKVRKRNRSSSKGKSRIYS